MIAALVNVRPVVGSNGREYRAELAPDSTRTLFLIGIDYPPDLWPPRDGDVVQVHLRPEVVFVERPLPKEAGP